MKKIAFIVDSSFRANEDFYKNENVYKVYFGLTDSEGNEYLDDQKSLSTEMIVEKFKNNLYFKSNAVVPGQVIAVLEEIINKYDYVICFTVSSGLSSYFANIQFLLEEQDFKNKLFIVDTKEIGFSEYLLIQEALKMSKEGKSIEEIIDFSNNHYLRNFTSFTCETWTYLMKSGRAPKILSNVFNKIKIYPVISFYKKNNFSGLCRSFEKIVSKIISDFKKTFNFKSIDEIDSISIYDNFLPKEKLSYIEDEIEKNLNFPKSKITKSLSPNLVLIYTGIGSFGIYIRSKNIRK